MSLMLRPIMDEQPLEGAETGLTLTVEDGTEVVDANTYISMADCSTYNIEVGNYAWSSYAQIDREAAILRAMRWIKGLETKWLGYRTTQTQELAWPRSGMYNLDDVLLGDDVIPEELKDALCEAAWHEITSKDVLNPGLTTSGGGVLEKKVKAGPVESTTKYSAATTTNTEFPAIMAMIEHFMKPVSHTRQRG
jgi:hypothetical protein